LLRRFASRNDTFVTGSERSGVIIREDLYKKQRELMVKEQIESRDNFNPGVLSAIRKIPRHLFLEEKFVKSAYEDNPLPIGENQTISQPYMVALMTDKLDLTGKETVLEIGTGSGYQTAILAELSYYVYSIERFKTLYEKAKYILKSLNYNNITLYCYSSLEQSSIYHPKLYILKGAKTITSIIGSSNLTAGGLKKNIEVNMVVTIDEHEEILSDIYATYNRLKFHPKRVIPDEEFIEYYASLCKLEKKGRINFTRNNLAKELLNNFEAKAKSLQRPRPTHNDLVGWTKLVFDQLPIGEFTTTETYVYENEFANLYPDNRNIKAKIRQQLQVLRDLSLIEHVGKSKWRKTSQCIKN